MNLSGNAVRYWLQKEKIEPAHLLVVVDDLALPFGTLRLKPKGSDAGHNGLKHIQETLGTNQYNRLRFGIGSDFPQGAQINFVLNPFTEDEQKRLPERIEIACEIIKSFCLAGIETAMNQFNNK
jgi:PTH1 family peptidyl-tRNA hydrolase